MKGNDGKSRVPVVDSENVLLRLVNGEVAGGRASGIDLADLFGLSVGTDLVGKDLSVVFNVFGAGVDHVEARVEARECRIDDLLGIAKDVEKTHGSIRGMESVDVDRVLCLAFRWVRELRGVNRKETGELSVAQESRSFKPETKR